MDQGSQPNPGATTGALDDPVYVAALVTFDEFYNELGRKYSEPWPRRQYGQHANWKAFLRVGTLCVERGWDPGEFVQNALQMITKRHKYITAKDLLAPAVVDHFAKFWKTKYLLGNPRDEWIYLTQQLLGWMETTGATETAVLRSPFTPFPSWFRLVYPEQLDEVILGVFGADARKELVRDARLRGLLREVTPSSMKRLEQLWGCFADTKELQS